jgi:hypothetical protein
VAEKAHVPTFVRAALQGSWAARESPFSYVHIIRCVWVMANPDVKQSTLWGKVSPQKRQLRLAQSPQCVADDLHCGRPGSMVLKTGISPCPAARLRIATPVANAVHHGTEPDITPAMCGFMRPSPPIFA